MLIRSARVTVEAAADERAGPLRGAVTCFVTHADSLSARAWVCSLCISSSRLLAACRVVTIEKNESVGTHRHPAASTACQYPQACQEMKQADPHVRCVVQISSVTVLQFVDLFQHVCRSLVRRDSQIQSFHVHTQCEASHRANEARALSKWAASTSASRCAASCCAAASRCAASSARACPICRAACASCCAAATLRSACACCSCTHVVALASTYNATSCNVTANGWNVSTSMTQRSRDQGDGGNVRTSVISACVRRTESETSARAASACGVPYAPSGSQSQAVLRTSE
jgi:hypothetical protein